VLGRKADVSRGLPVLLNTRRQVYVTVDLIVREVVDRWGTVMDRDVVSVMSVMSVSVIIFVILLIERHPCEANLQDPKPRLLPILCIVTSPTF
jgi:hypothetical protein